jgi:hypothetical protein
VVFCKLLNDFADFSCSLAATACVHLRGHPGAVDTTSLKEPRDEGTMHRKVTTGSLVIVTVALIVAVDSVAIAQTNTGEVSGVVRDVLGGVLPGATVTARHQASGLVVERMTDSTGRFFLRALRTGHPFAVNLGVDQANVGAGPAQRPDQRQDPNLARSSRTPDQWFNTSAFALPAPHTFGSAPRNSVIGPGFANVDLAIAKTWGLARDSQLEFRWEIFNVFNRTNFDIPNRIFGTPNFGRIFSAKSPREMQFGLRLMF